jgi:hypothetical protein
VLEVKAAISTSGLTGTETDWREIGGLRFAEAAEVGPFTQADGYDGQAVWSRDGSGLVWVDGGQSARAQAISLGFVVNYALWAPNRGGAEVAWGGPRSEAGADYDALVITAPGSAAPFELWFDARTHLPARFVQHLGAKTLTQTFADYRPAAGLMIPYRTRNTDLNGNDTDAAVLSVSAPKDAEAHLTRPASDVHDFSIQGGQSETRVPIELIDNHVYLSVMLNGKGPYRFIFDTGGENLIDPAVAKEIGAVGQGEAQGAGAGADTQAFSVAKVGTLGIGEAVVKDQVFAIAPVRQGFGVAAGEQVDGLIGFEVVARFVTTFDYGGRSVVLALPGGGAPPAGETVPIVLSERIPQFPCAIDGIAAQCTLDTGARDSIGFYGPFVAAHPQIRPAVMSAIGVDGFGFGGPSFGRLGRLQSLRIGSITLPDLVADFTADEKGAMAAPFLAGNVGGGVWRRFALTLDYGHQTMTLVPNADLARPDDYEHAGLFLIERDGKHVVLDARPGAPAAEAGIAKGDVVETIDGTPAAGMSLQAIRARLSGPAGEKLTLGLVGKDGVRRTVVLTLRPFI